MNEICVRVRGIPCAVPRDEIRTDLANDIMSARDALIEAIEAYAAIEKGWEMAEMRRVKWDAVEDCFGLYDEAVISNRLYEDALIRKFAVTAYGEQGSEK